MFFQTIWTHVRSGGRKLAALAAAAILAHGLTPSATADAGPALWKLTDEDSEIWLFGTIHILSPDLVWRSEEISKAFTSADTLITEAPTNEADPATMQQLVATYGVDKTGQKFLEKLSPEADEHFSTVLARLGMPETAKANFAQLRPWLASVTLQVLQIQAEGGSPDAGVDNILWNDAKAAGKELAYLETLDEQMQIFGNLSPEEELFFFEQGLKQMVEEPDLMNRLIDLWQTGATEDLGTLMQSSMTGMDGLYAALLTNRNKNWAAQIKTLMDGSGSYFIAVGSGHLAGENSVQDFLKTHGLEAVRQ